MNYHVEIADLAALRIFAAGFAASLRAGDVVALYGEVGAGKTTFVRFVGEYLHCSDEISSPSFTFWQRYDGALKINHLDLYRIEDDRELRELGLEDAFTDSDITFVEWPERALQLLPARYVALNFTGAGDEPRLVRVRRT